MASTPSASALSSVLRWARNPPTKRPSGAAYSLGLTGAAPQRTGSSRASAWTLAPLRERVAAWRRLAVAWLWGSDVSSEADYGKKKKLRHPKVSQPAGNRTPHSARAVPNTQARGLKSALHGGDKFSTILHMVEYNKQAAHVCGRICARVEKLPRGVLKLSVTENSGAGSTPQNSCLSLTYLVSKVFFLKLCRPRSGTDNAHLAHLQLQHEHSRQKDKRTCPGRTDRR